MRAMARVNVIIPDELLETLDRAADEEDTSRSGLIQQAAQQWLEDRRRRQEAAERKVRMEQAASNMDRLAEKFGKWDGMGTIRQFRDQRSGAKR